MAEKGTSTAGQEINIPAIQAELKSYWSGRDEQIRKDRALLI